MNRIPYFDGWRGLAILAVLFAHFVFSGHFNAGRFGVELFFALSGRLMAEILFVKGAGLKRFYFHRISRIFPALIAFATIIFLISGPLSMGVTLPGYLSVLTLTYNYAIPFIGQMPAIDHIWSLCIEEHMYIFLGLVAFVCRRYGFNPVYLIAIAALTFMINGLVQSSLGLGYYAVYWRSDVRGASILAAAAMYLCSQDARFKPYFEGQTSLYIAIVAALIINFDAVPDEIKYTAGTLCISYAMASLPRANKLALSLLSFKPLTYFGLTSYSIYLWQQPFAFSLLKFLEPLGVGYNTKRLLLLVGAIAVGLVSYYVVEGPSRRWLNNLAARRNAKLLKT
ncbi:acyltransferase [Asticcacaulis sp. 201]|uniref:acyltransferase family protein n=1 Tax=Asticcacaulis sp. 201 TaxID=3028787 RepID=UPI0029161443|nr:acyltransferase [Asticcacaulis sp. 201]MDV6329656.1 acyltransferase [Asticcacaulis sp. 201]